MKEIKINSFEELQEYIFKDCFDDKVKRYRNDFVYRGVGDDTFALTSSLNRICSHNLELERSIMRSFKKYGYTDIKDINSNWQVLATGQHYGLPTRLLDWSYSPLVAAHFATEDYSLYDKDGAIYCFNLDEVDKQLPKELKDELEYSNTHVFSIKMMERHMKDFKDMKLISEDPYFLFYEPASGSDRMSNQYALFSVCSDTNYTLGDLMTKDNMESLYKIIIPKEIKLEIRDKLDYINISERMIYPGLDGVCRWITRRYANLGPQYNKKNSE